MYEKVYTGKNMNFLKSVFYCVLLLAVFFNACINIKNRESANEDQWFLDKYPDEYLDSTLVDFDECARLIYPETKDKVKHIRIIRPETADYSKLLEFPNMVTLQSQYSTGGLSNFSQFKKLEALMVIYAGIGEYNFIDLVELTELEYIDFNLEAGSEVDFSGIENLKKLKVIMIETWYIPNIEKFYSTWPNPKSTYKNTELLDGLTELEYLYMDEEIINLWIK